MTSVMLGGSRKIHTLPQTVLDTLAEHIAAGDWFLLGDATGVDLAFQQALSTAKYPRAVVFSSLPQPRNNIGRWDFRFVDSGLKSRGAAMHTVKDRRMVELADAGLMVWDGESPGTLANVIDFVDSGKECLIWMPGESMLWRVDSPEARDSLIEGQIDVAQESLKRLATYRKRVGVASAPPAPPTLFD